MKRGYPFKRKSPTKEHSRKYVATIAQIIGIAFCTPLASYFHQAILSNSLYKLDLIRLESLISVSLLLIGLYAISRGQSFMIDLDKVENENE